MDSTRLCFEARNWDCLPLRFSEARGSEYSHILEERCLCPLFRSGVAAWRSGDWVRSMPRLRLTGVVAPSGVAYTILTDVNDKKTDSLDEDNVQLRCTNEYGLIPSPDSSLSLSGRT